MAARRLIVAMLVLLVFSTVLASQLPVQTDESSTTTTSTTTTQGERAPAPGAGKLVQRKIAVDDATPETIDLARGDQLELTVTSAKLADRVEIPAFGDSELVDPDFPAQFDLLALESGSYVVRLVEAGRVIGRIEVASRQGNDERGRSNDSPGSSNTSSDSGASSPS